ncbi:MAG: SDR family oxidoreductase [Bacteroidota bacterium]
MQIPNVLLAGSTGYLGGYLARELHKNKIPTRLLARNPEKVPPDDPGLGVTIAEVTQPETLAGCMHEIDIVISTIGITRQNDGLRYIDVDFQANMNLLREARISGVKRFIYVASLHGDKLQHLKICEAKEKFVDALKASGMDYTIVRPNGFFSDLGEFLKMAQKGRIFLPGDGNKRLNPIHGADLAEAMISLLLHPAKEFNIGGPEIFTQNQIAQMCFAIAGKQSKVTYVPNWLRKGILFVLRTFTSSRIYGPYEFFLTTLAMDMIAPPFGKRKLQDYLEQLTEQTKTEIPNHL